MRHLSRAVVGLTAVALFVAPPTAAAAGEGFMPCLGGHDDGPTDPAAPLIGQENWDAPLSPALAAAAAKYRVPLDLLLVLGRMGSGFENRGAAPTIERGYGVMALRRNQTGGDSLDLAAALTGIDSEQLKTDPVANIHGAAAVLDEYAREEGIDRAAGIEAWLPVVIRYAGLDEEASRIFARTVFSLLVRGTSTTNSRGEAFAIQPRAVAMDLDALLPPALLPEVSPTSCGDPDYAPAIWTPAASCNFSTANSNKDTVLIHMAEGSAAGTISWFRNCNSGVSTQYVVDLDGTVYQMVCEKHIAYHGNTANSRSIGLEHAGYTSDTSHPEAQYQGSAACVRDMCNRWGIAKEKRRQPPGIIGHIDVTECLLSGSHTDPGRGWNWGHYMALVNQTSDPVTFVVESRSGGQNYASYSEVGSFSNSTVKSNLWDTTAGIGHRLAYSTGGHEAIYRYTPTATGTYRVFAAWPTSANASRVVEHVVTHAGGSASVVLDTNADSIPCGRNNWNLLGTFTLNAGVQYRVTQTDATHRDSLVIRSDAVKWERVSTSSGNPPTITQHPQPQAVAPGGTAVFTVAATGEGTLSYRWQKNGSDLNNGGHYSGVTTTTLTISNADADDVAQYRCAVSNAYGTTPSNAAALTLQGGGQTEFIVESRSGGLNFNRYSETGTWSDSTAKSTAPSVTSGIGSRFAYISTAGQDAVFSFTPGTAGLYEVFVTGPLSTNTPTSAHHVITHAGGSADVYVDQNNNSNPGYSTRWNSLGQYTLNASATYTVTITTTGSTAGTGSTALRSDAVRWLLISGSVSPPTVTQHPAAQNVCPSGTAMFTVQATGDGTLGYQWQKNSGNLSNSGHYAGVTTATLTVAGADANDAANYRCVVSNAGGSVTSNTAALTLKAATQVTQHPTQQEVTWGGTAVFTVQATGDGTLGYLWQKNNANLSNGGHYSGATTATLTITNADGDDVAAYRCVVSGGCGVAISLAGTLLVNDPPAPQITAAVSRKVHGGTTGFDADVLADGAVECRNGGPTLLVITFDQPIQQVSGTLNDVSVSSGAVTALAVNADQLTVTLGEATDAAWLAVAFPGIEGPAGQAVTDGLCFGVLAGDVNGDAAVNVLDLVAVRNLLNQNATAGSFRADVNADGGINVLDLVAVRNRLNTAAEGCP